MLLAGAGAARAQDATPPQAPAAPDPNGAPAQPEPPQAEPAQPDQGTQAPPPPADYGTPPGYNPQAAPGYPPPPPPAYPPPAYPPPPYGPRSAYPPPPGYGGYPPPYAVGSPGNIHDGFFLRLHLGGGFTDIKGNGLEISGGSVSLGVALGGALAENLILFGNFFLSVADTPDVKGSGPTFTSSGSATLGGFGVGLTYYFMPVNVYLSGALAGMIFEMDNSDGSKLYSSNFGLGFQGMVGKEWWVSPEWGLGVAAELTVASMKDENDSSNITWSGSSFSLVFSSTFN
ncbi:MAG: hypothetical protein ACJ8F1_21050 [Polyangia bacterium]